MFGLGLLEAVPADDILALADPDDDDGDGISGRANLVPDPDAPTASRSSAGSAGRPPSRASSSRTPAPSSATSASRRRSDPSSTARGCSPSASSAPDGGDPELDDRKLEQVTFYTRTLAVPARRDVGVADTDGGPGALRRARLRRVPRRRAAAPARPTSRPSTDRPIRPYTDLLLHDMGEGSPTAGPTDASSGRRPTGSEWRTPPLWGIGLVETVNGHTRFLHDGRARSLEEAILWHGGEAERAREALPRPRRRAAGQAHRLPGEPVTRTRTLAVALSLALARRGGGCCDDGGDARAEPPTASTPTGGARRRSPTR